MTMQEGEENFFEKKFSSPSCTSPTIQKTRKKDQFRLIRERLDRPYGI